MTNYAEITDLMRRKLTFLEDTRNFYNLSNRSVFNGPYYSRCTYASVSENSPGCAIGRHLDAKLAADLDKRGFGLKFFMDLFPAWMSEMGENFLLGIQKLHDMECYWNETGLNELGLQVYYTIKQSVLEGKL